VLVDLAEAAGYGDSAGRRATGHLAHDAAGWLGEQLVVRTASRFTRSLVPVVGVGMGAGISLLGVRKVTKLPMRPAAPDEILRLADEVMADPDSYPVERTSSSRSPTRPHPPPGPERVVHGRHASGRGGTGSERC
jgi:hypothetical protein